MTEESIKYECLKFKKTKNKYRMDKHLEIINFIKGIYPGKDIIHLHEPKFGGNEKKYLLDIIFKN